MNCPKCKKGSIEDDSQCGSVCMSCGSVFQEKVFTSDVQFEGTRIVNQSRNYVNFNVKDLPKSIRSHNTVSISKGKELGLESILSLSSYLRLPSAIKDEITELFIEMIDDNNFKFDKLPKKIGLVACCTYIVLRRNHFPIVISKICNFLQCSSTDFSKTYSAVLELKKISMTTPTFDELVPSILKNLLCDEASRIIPIVLDILRVACDCWITSGRILPPYIIAAGFVAWKSLSYERRKCSFATFCKSKHVVQYYNTSGVRVKELCSFLMKLAEELPWIEKGKVNIKDIPYMLDGILKHSEMLCSGVIQPEGDDEQSKNIKKYQTFRAPSLKRKHKVEYDCDSYSSDFDDNSLNCYIRTEKEVTEVKKFLEKKRIKLLN